MRGLVVIGDVLASSDGQVGCANRVGGAGSASRAGRAGSPGSDGKAEKGIRVGGVAVLL